MIVAGTGHRPDKIGGYKIPNPIYNWIIDHTIQILTILHPSKIISGAALGFDTYLADAALHLNIPLLLAIPFLGQEKIWPKASQDKYNQLKKDAAEVVIVSEGGYSAKKMQIRNCWMTDRSDISLMCFDGSKGGTHNNVQYILNQNKDWIRLDPKLLQISYSLNKLFQI